MSDRAAVVATLAEYATKPATSHDTRAQPGEVFSAPPFELLRQFLQSLRAKSELDALLAEVAPLIRSGDPFRTSVIAVNCGTMVEMGGDPALVAPHLLAALPHHLTRARRAPNSTFETDPDAARTRAGLTFLMLATMAVLCRGAAFRQAARANPDIAADLEALGETHREAGFVSQVLGFTDGLELLVLAPNEVKGFRVACDAIATCAHLFTLLQASLIGGGHLEGEALDDEVLGVATGEVPHTRRLYDRARFNFTTWRGLTADGELEGVRVSSLIPVDWSPVNIPRFEGERIVLVGPTVLGSRSWDSGFFANIHDALRSRTEVVEVLPPEQVVDWLDRIKRTRA